MTPEQFIDLLEKLIGKQLQKKMFHLGKIASIDGDRASVYIDGSTIPTPNVPYNPNIKFNTDEEVWVVYINFDPNDKFILCKRGTETPDPPPSGDGQMQMHGNEWHTASFETAAGAQEKVDTHANSKSTHGVGSNYIAKTTNPNQWPLWTEIENKPSEFTPSTHSHDLDEITETEGKKIMTAEERTKLEGIEPGANKYIHPEKHPASMIIEASSKRFVSDVEKANWNAKETPSGAQAKADTAEANAKSYTDIHDQNTTKHITATERTNWNDANAKKHTHSNKSILDTITQTLINTWNSAVDHISDAVKHITSAERARWNNKQDAIEGLPQVYSSENSDKFLLYRPSTGDYRSITKEDLLSGLGGTDEYIFRVKRQEFTTTEGQTIFTIDGQYLPNNNRISVYVWGNRQPNTAYEETNSNTITLIDGLPAGTKVIIEWFEVVNVMDYIHAESHATDGTDPITPEMIGAVPAVEGKGLSTEDYTTAEKNKLAGIEDGANKYVHPSTHPASMITETSSKRFVSDTEKANWNAKETPSGAQAKADAALNSAKQYTDQEVAEVSQALDAHLADNNNPHGVTKTQVGLGNVDNVKQVPITRKINNKELSQDIMLSASDVKAETPAGAQAKADAAEANAKGYTDTHAGTKNTHGVGSGYYIAKTSRSDQLPAWNDVQGKPSNFTPSAHKSTHASGGSDALTPSDIGAETPAGAQAKAEAAAGAVQAELDAHLAAIATQEQLGHVKVGQNLVIDSDGTLHAQASGGKKVARFVIGTSTAGWTLEDCDYLCDGTNDQEEIIQALDDLPATGGEVVILDGTYNITASINIPKDNVSIRGSGNATTLKRMYNSTNTDSGPTAKGLITLNGKSGCKIQGLQIDGNKAIYTANYNSGIYLYSSSDNTVTGNICNNSNNGIRPDSSSNNTITGNICNNNNYSGIRLDSSSNNTITGNTCNNNSDSGIYLPSSSNNTVTGNTCNNNGNGIRLSSSSNNTITGNTCNNNSDGIRLYSSSNNTITGNTCNNNSCGINISSSSNNTVTGNTCIRGTGQTSDYASNQYTIRLQGTTGNYNLISSNNCMGKAPVVEGGTGNTVFNNKWDESSDFEDLRADVVAHKADAVKHITSAERTRWNNKAEVSQIPTKVSQLENDRGYVTQEELGDAGYGNMLKSIYDQNNNGIVDNAEKLGGKLPSYYEQVYHTGATPPTNTNLLWIDTGA
jgi:parallel beta-helix repeat protein